ncbi:Carbohydrate binding module (family 6) [Natronoarchaeum philippinense]|uniref:Carbohydrate binding module (Family 6) n=1 Tax=Natronoarchaeum philippinense TaxID=558529 RepID=A0A285N5Y2_NATPI|nr:glycoside hydrolase family 97 catalytic domain-containing protein [Natronoarchaeum philippinense]SNZ03121.1 Carbohydrate binding module (family 6) [Natronoarchaeum philippinense]
MFEETNAQQTGAIGRRQFVGGVASLLAASAYSLSVPESVAASVVDGDDEPVQTVASPDGRLEVTVDAADGVPTYEVAYDDSTVVEESALGFEFQNQPTFREGLSVTGTERDSVDSTWEPVWDQYEEIRERYNELRVGLAESGDGGRSGTLELRAFDDGFGLRFVFGESFGDFVVTSERTEYNFAGDYTSWWIPNDWNNFEVEYRETPLSGIESGLDGAPVSAGGNGVHTPMTMRTDEDLYLSVHEANLDDYASLAIAPAGGDGPAMESTLAPLPDGTKVSATAPHMTPWRTFQIGTRPGELMESSLVLNLNEDYDESVFTQGVDWIEPQKFIGIWWLMITGRADWTFTGMNSGNHGAQTGRAKQYMDFASEHSIPGVLIEGWNEGWSSYPGDGSAFDYTEPYPDFDLQEVTDYGPNLDPPTQMTMHNETAGDFENYESQADEAFDLYDDLGIRTIKNGYVADSGNLAGEGFNHHNQVLVNHHTLIAETAAANRQMLDIHEPIHPTGRRRTYPNLMTREGVKGQEYDSFGFVSPEHHVTFPFTRMLGGPVEYTPGIFDMDSGSGGIETTRAKQLAMYPTYFSGLQMAADLPSSYLADQPATLGVGEVAQAEWADLDGFSTAARWANAQGEQYVPVDPNTVAAGATASWTVEGVESAGEYDVHLRYASDAEENAVPQGTPRTATVLVDGTERAQVTLPPTEYWDTWGSVSTTVSLESGDSDIAVALTDADTGGFNLDSIAVTESGESMPEPETAPIRGETVPAFQFIEDVPAAWDDTRVVDAEIGDYTITARKSGDEWFVGAMSDENGRAIDVPLSFLDDAPGERKGHEKGRGRGHGGTPGNGNAKGRSNSGRGGWNGDEDNHREDCDHERGRGHTKGKYVAEIYSDGIEARYDSNLTDVRIDEAIVDADTEVLASMVGSGGTALRIRPATWEEVRELPHYERPEQEFDVSIDAETFIQEPFVQATGTNFGEYLSGTTVDVFVDGEFVRSENVRFAPDSSDGVDEFTVTIDDPGSYEVTVRSTDGETLASQTVTVKPPETIATFDDPAGDDYGPGGYTYPTAGAFEEGTFDLRSVTVEQTPSIYQFTFEVENLNDGFGGDFGFSPHMFVMWVRDPDKSGGTTQTLPDLGANATFEAPWHYRVEISGFTKSAVTASGATVTDDDGNAVRVGERVDPDANTVELSIDRAAFDGVDARDLEIVPMVQSEDLGTLRPVAETAADYVFGGATPGAAANTPRIMDMITPEGVSQADALAYSADELATLPFVSID